MARASKCKVCGWTGEPDGQRRWLGTNHNLCSACVVTCDRCNGTGRTGHMIRSGGYRCSECHGKKAVSTDTPLREPSGPMPPMGMMAMVAMAAAVSVAPHRRKDR
jgi:hypothetical protein